jgi:hypothetical protein
MLGCTRSTRHVEEQPTLSILQRNLTLLRERLALVSQLGIPPTRPLSTALTAGALWPSAGVLASVPGVLEGVVRTCKPRRHRASGLLCSITGRRGQILPRAVPDSLTGTVRGHLLATPYSGICKTYPHAHRLLQQAQLVWLECLPPACEAWDTAASDRGPWRHQCTASTHVHAPLLATAAAAD